MCGIVGVVNLDRTPVDSVLLKRMADRIAHRGPDEEGSFTRPGIGLYHKRLAIIDLVSGRQPMTADDVTIVFNGEIYNYLELRADLIARGHRFETQSDSEVLLRAYLEFGADCVRLLNGMFAFLLFDARQRRLLVARDHFGVKPLYFHCGTNHLLYASEIKALLAHPALRAETCMAGLDDYVTFQFTLAEQTMFKGVQKLPPGHLQVVDLANGSIESRRYWEPDFTHSSGLSEDESVEQLAALVDDSVRLQMRSDVPVGTYLSGGLDSSTVTMAASRHAGSPLIAFTGAFREGVEYDESRYARIVADAAGATSMVIYPTQSDFVDVLPKLVYHMDEPAAGPGLFPQYMVSRLAKQHVKVCLGGQGADEIYAGYARYTVAYFEQAVKAAVNGQSEEGDEAIPIEDMGRALGSIRQYAPMLKRFVEKGFFGPMDQRYFRLVDRTEGMLHLYSRDFRSRFDADRQFNRFAAIFNRPATRSYFDKMTYFDMVSSLPALLQVEDRVSMAVSLESRVPLLDHRMVDLVCSLPARIKFRDAELKYLFRRAVAPLLPPPVLERRDKMGFPVPLQHWARGRARDFFHDTLLSRACRERGLFDMDAVRSLIDKDQDYGRALWGLLQLELWHQQFIDRSAAATA